MPVKTPGLPGVHVPMCEPCNSRLNTRFEVPAQPIVRSLLSFDLTHSWPTLSVAETEALALWLLKVGLLSAHPDAVHDVPHVDKDDSYPRLDPFLPVWAEWMRTGAPPPDGFSVYVTRRAIEHDVPLVGAKRQVQLPRIIVDGEDLRFVQRSFGFRGVNVTIVWHPGWEIDNAQVNEGRAARLWPQPSVTDFAALPEVNPREFQFVDALPLEISTTRAQYEDIISTPLDHDTDVVALVIASISD